jgi:hypothetical protein
MMEDTQALAGRLLLVYNLCLRQGHGMLGGSGLQKTQTENENEGDLLLLGHL